ncbi:MAG: molybdenum cofactor guanylyltransferase MobA [Paracoccaceae bacterium]
MLIFGIILAGGMGRRMGGADKALLDLAGRPLVAHVADRIGPQVAALAVSANGDPARLAALGLPVLPDDLSLGPLSGLLQGLRWAAGQGATLLLSVPVDAPFLPGDLVPRLLMAGEGARPALARSGGRVHPVCGLWPTGLAPALERFLASGAKARVMDFATAHDAALADFPQDGAFSNLNTPEDLAHAEALLKGCP